MRRPSDYANYSAGARAAALALDLLAAPFVGLPVDRPRNETAPDPIARLDRRAETRPLRFLLIRPDHAGDLLMATPAIRALRRARPGAVIELLASPWGAPAVVGNPDLDGLSTIEATWFEPGRREGPDPSRLIGALVSLRFGARGGYDAAADLRGDFRSILIARATGAGVRAGFDRLGLERLLTTRTRFDPSMPHIDRNHAVLRSLGAGPIAERRPVFVVPARARERARRLLAACPGGAPILAVFPGTNRPAASWGAARFAETCRSLAERGPISVVLCGREADRSAAETIASAVRVAAATLDLTGRTDFADAAAILELASAALANDSGAAHLAVAVGTPIVAIFGPTDPRTLWTWDRPERFIALAGPSGCARPCFRAGCAGDHGYAAIAPADVAVVLRSVLRTGGSRSGNRLL